MTPDVVRCKGKPHGRLIEPGVWEVKCDSRICGAGPGIVVLHQFDTTTGAEIKTMVFRDPNHQGGE